jgi:short-subunit dehydrogenase
MALAKSSKTPHPQRDAMILITGATGNIGRRVAELLSKRGETLRLMGRRVESMPELASRSASSVTTQIRLRWIKHLKV